MIKKRFKIALFALFSLFCLSSLCGCISSTPDPLPSWNPDATKDCVINFVEEVTDPSNPSYMLPEDRIAVFDNDGTLMCEQPMSVPTAFIFHGLVTKAEDDPSVRDKQPYKAVWEKDASYFASLNEEELNQLILKPYSGITQTEYIVTAKAFVDEAKHPHFKVPYTRVVYQPMLELLRYLNSKDFEVFIVSGGMAGFMRAYSEQVYNVPRENVIGTSATFEYVVQDGRSSLIRIEKFVEPFNDYDGKAINIQLHIGKRPIIAVGNSDGDMEMLEFTDDREGPGLMLLVHHDDAEREYQYDKGAEKVLKVAKDRNWTVISMKNDFQTVFTFEQP
ncbi:MAG: HAD family hydrolase [Chloroflexota bacterium]|nr:HAD family hydrolase [Chloroflexota bacterium]